MLINIYTSIQSAQTWLSAYAAIYNLYTQYSYQLADAVGAGYEYRAQLVSSKKYPDDVYAQEMENSVTERAKISIHLNKAQGDLLRSRVEFSAALLTEMLPHLRGVDVKPHDYDLLMLLDDLIINDPKSPLLTKYVSDISSVMIDGDATKLLFQKTLETKRELPDLPFSIGQPHPSIECTTK